MSGLLTLEVRDHLDHDRLGEGIGLDRTLSAAGDRACAVVDPCRLLPRHFAFFHRTIPGIAEPPEAAALHVLRAEGAGVAGRDGVVVVSGAWVDRIQLYFADYGRQGCLFERPQAGARSLQVQAPSRRLAGEAFLGFNAAFSNYAHWISDGLPALVAYRDHYMDGGCRLLMPHLPETHFIEQGLRLLGIPEGSIERIGDEHLLVDTLYFLSYFNYSRLPHYAAEAQRRLKAEVEDLPPARSRRLFVARPDSRARRLLNEAEVLAALAAYKVEVVAPGLLSLAEQIRTFHAADMVVGPHGAGLVNCGFCEPDAALLELFSEYTTQSHFWIVASAARMRYGFVAGTSIDQDWGLWSEADNWDAPYVLDAAAVASGVRGFAAS